MRKGDGSPEHSSIAGKGDPMERSESRRPVWPGGRVRLKPCSSLAGTTLDFIKLWP
jgi:hypothetical protein